MPLARDEHCQPRAIREVVHAPVHVEAIGTGVNLNPSAGLGAGDEIVTVERMGKDFVAARPGRLGIQLIEASANPALAVAFDDEGAHRRRIPVVVRVEGSVFRRDEGLR